MVEAAILSESSARPNAEFEPLAARHLRFLAVIAISSPVLLHNPFPHWSGCLARIRTYDTVSENQALALPDTQIDTQKIRNGFEICEVIQVWPRLPDALRAAILAIIRTHEKDLSIAVCREALTGRASPEGTKLARSALSGRETGCGQVDPGQGGGESDAG